MAFTGTQSRSHLIRARRRAARWCGVLASALVVVLLATGCAVFFQGNTQGIPVESVPAGASVFLDGKRVGVTPLTVVASLSSDHAVWVRRGDVERQFLLVRRHGPDPQSYGWVALDAAPGTIATVVDLALSCPSGGMYPGLCRDLANQFLPFTVAAALLPAAADAVYISSLDHLEPGKIAVRFE